MATKKITMTTPKENHESVQKFIKENGQTQSGHYTIASIFYRASMERKRKKRGE